MPSAFFRRNSNVLSTKLLDKIITSSHQSRTLLFIGKPGWGKTSAGLDFAQKILNAPPLEESNFFYFRNDHHLLKATFFLTHHIDSIETWIWLKLLQRRIAISSVINESLLLPSSLKLGSFQEKLLACLTEKKFPLEEKMITQIMTIAEVLDKKTTISINLIRELIAFHSIHTPKGRVSLIGNFDQADSVTQNAALKIIEEPHPNHWIILTAETTKNIIPTILSRTVQIPFQEPSPNDLTFLDHQNKQFTSSLDIMEEKIFGLSSIKKELISDFFTKCTPTIEHSIFFLQFIEELKKNGHIKLFLEELTKCFENTLRIRHQQLRKMSDLIPIKYPEYRKFSEQLIHASTAEMEELVLCIQNIQEYVEKSAIKIEFILPPLFLSIARLLRRIKS